MLKCKKNQILRPIVPGSGEGGGTQPTLFAPKINVSGNTVTWQRDTRNGGFGDVVSGSIDGNAVSTPLYLNSSLDKKTLVVTSTALHFKDGSSSTVLNYISVQPVTKKCVVVIDQFWPGFLPGGKSEEYKFIRIYAQVFSSNISGTRAFGEKFQNKAKFVYNGVDYPLNSDHIAYYFDVETQTGRQEVDLYLDIYDAVNDLPQDTYVQFRLERYKEGGEAFGVSVYDGETFGFKDDVPAGTNKINPNSQTGIKNGVYIFLDNVDNNEGIYTAYFDMRVA